MLVAWFVQNVYVLFTSMTIYNINNVDFKLIIHESTLFAHKRTRHARKKLIDWIKT